MIDPKGSRLAALPAVANPQKKDPQSGPFDASQ
jgi:hypothetical protein